MPRAENPVERISFGMVTEVSEMTVTTTEMMTTRPALLPDR
jgi:hypothetical protein